MGLAAYGKPTRIAELERLLRVGEDGGFALDPAYFAFRRGERMGSGRLAKLIGPARAPDAPLTDAHRDLAASAQALLERAILANTRSLRAKHGLDALCLGGGVALNCLANGRVAREAGFSRVFVPPGCGDSGGAIGAALYLSSLLGRAPGPHGGHAYWGPGYLEREMEREIRASRFAYRRLDDGALVSEAASLLSHGKILGWFQGDMEFGPRALGNRSILASPVAEGTKVRVNELKRREQFRPFAPVVPRERVGEFFEWEAESPFMLFAASVRSEWRARLPAITHVDGTARVQTVDAAVNPRLHALLRAFEPAAHAPVLLNTSFNLDDEPIVCSPADALRTFARSGLDALVMGNFVVQKA